MDMVSEGLRNANSWLTMSETPVFLASYLDGLTQSVMNYVWRTNDIVYRPGAPRGRPGGQYFPIPMWEKNGSRDAFRFFIHETTGGSDHIVFNNPSVGVAGIELFTWPDQWYHADTDTPDKGDRTEMKRVAFIGAATAWASAHLTDAMVPDLLDAVSDFGYNRVAERGIPRALEVLDQAKADGWEDPGGTMASARAILAAAVRREMEAMDVVPGLAPGIRSVETYLGRWGPMQEYLTANPDALPNLGLSRGQTTQIQNFINGERSVTEILSWVRGVTGEATTLQQVQAYLEILQQVGWITIQGG